MDVKLLISKRHHLRTDLNAWSSEIGVGTDSLINLGMSDFGQNDVSALDQSINRAVLFVNERLLTGVTLIVRLPEGAVISDEHRALICERYAEYSITLEEAEYGRTDNGNGRVSNFTTSKRNAAD